MKKINVCYFYIKYSNMPFIIHKTNVKYQVLIAVAEKYLVECLQNC